MPTENQEARTLVDEVSRDLATSNRLRRYSVENPDGRRHWKFFGRPTCPAGEVVKRFDRIVPPQVVVAQGGFANGGRALDESLSGESSGKIVFVDHERS